ncbi:MULTISPECIES: aromatic amino acid transport family protein [Helcobacillus]|uniref:Serine transporter n=1 Tax=Helcobacillus massiliensis TaxID=521392 RepID=A0A839QXX0_9MICO|nr:MULTISPECIES: aromatic amino acid transport family protein [Helcobacillus]MBB3022247.1 serine transporter [Helcobacillus massiliensis]MCG7426530.1 HAAAP family serine/threonine permease [Helcobacillus sp. ACRRO]MDK7740959.1 aromatic amino acid transport family protein [Helcobacillus massiliensis]WOO93777.1 aromatic amino acid transport family protein [Helcobacillus massiliensis]
MSSTPENLSNTTTASDGEPKASKRWAISMFGTAVGAGILFLPISAGEGGVWPLLILTIIVGPLVFLAHRGLSRYVLSSDREDADITTTSEDHYGHAIGMVITVLYFLAILPIVLIYGVSITNTVDGFIQQQLHGPEIPRWLLALVLVGAMMLVMLFGQKLMLMITGWIVVPLILALFTFSIYLIPQWDFSAFSQAPSATGLLTAVWLAMPTVVFAFNHSPAISQFSLAMREEHGDDANAVASKTLGLASTILVVFTMLFVWSCVLAMGSDGMAQARASNDTVLTFMANTLDNPIIAYAGPIIAMAAITSSFFGHYLGAAEGAVGIIRAVRRTPREDFNAKTVQKIVAVLLFVITWLVAVANPQILDIIEQITGPVIAMILFILPVVGIYTIPALKPFRRQWVVNAFVVVFGLIAISGLVTQFFL